MGTNTMNRNKALAVLFAVLFCTALIGIFITASGIRAPADASFAFFLGQDTAGGADAADETAPDLIRFFAVQDSEEYGLVLPESWDASHLRIYFSGAGIVRIGFRFYRSGDPISLKQDEPFTVKLWGGKAIRVTMRKTGGLPVLFVRTDSGSSDAIHTSKAYQELGMLILTDPGGTVLYHERLSAVRTRGNATFAYAKKPYQIRLEKPAALIGEKKDKTWILLANALDRSQIRNTLAFDLSRFSGAFSYTPQAQPVDLYMNAEYCGTYLLTEKIEMGENRVAVRDLEKAIKDINPDLDFDALEPLGDLESAPGAYKYRSLPAVPGDKTGGYILQMNKTERYSTEACGFVTDRGYTVTLQEPKYVNKAQIRYLASLVQCVEDALFSEGGVDPGSGRRYSDLLDFPSFVNRYMIAEVLNDYDGQYCYFYKDSDTVNPKVYAGPVWDQDNILGVWGPEIDPAAVHIRQEPGQACTWFEQALQQDDFRAAAKEAYRDTYRPAMEILLGREKDPSGVLRSVDEYASEVRESAQADFFRWKNPMVPNDKFYNASIGSTFEEQIDYLKYYLAAHQEALDAFFGQL